MALAKCGVRRQGNKVAGKEGKSGRKVAGRSE